MAELYDITSSTTITSIVESCELEQELNQIVNYSSAGVMYMQIIGNPRKYYSVVCYVTRTQLGNLNSAWSTGHLMRITMSHGTYYGRITEFNRNTVFSENNLAFDGVSSNEYFKVDLKLAHSEAPSSS